MNPPIFSTLPLNTGSLATSILDPAFSPFIATFFSTTSNTWIYTCIAISYWQIIW